MREREKGRGFLTTLWKVKKYLLGHQCIKGRNCLRSKVRLKGDKVKKLRVVLPRYEGYRERKEKWGMGRKKR